MELNSGIRLKEGHNLILRNYPVPASQMEKGVYRLF